MSYKKVICLYGPPGTGKTSLVKALASKYKKSISTLDISQMSDKNFLLALERNPYDSFVFIEDFDSCKTLHNRNVSDQTPLVIQKQENSSDTKPPKSTVPTTSIETYDSVSLSGFLNALQGAAELN